MNHSLKLAAIGLAALALAACSGTSTSTSIPNPGSMTQQTSHVITQVAGLDLTKVHIYPTLGHQVGVIPNAPQTLSYFGGAVLKTPHVYVVFWGFGTYGDPSGVKPYLISFLKGVGGSQWEGLMKQYYQVVGGVKQHVQNPTNQYKNSWVDNSTVPAHPSDAQVQAEATRLMQHFSYGVNNSYVVVTPTQHGSPGFGTSYCAYHGEYTSPKGALSYTNLGYMTDPGAACGMGFVNSPGTLDGVSIVEGHEYAESITDVIPGAAWYNFSYGEIGDICAWLKPPAGNITLSTGTFAVQGLWSNKESKCSITG